MASRQIYEQGGWADGRLGQAYDLIDAVLRDNEDCPGSDLRADLFTARAATETADASLADHRKTAEA